MLDRSLNDSNEKSPQLRLFDRQITPNSRNSLDLNDRDEEGKGLLEKLEKESALDNSRLSNYKYDDDNS